MNAYSLLESLVVENSLISIKSTDYGLYVVYDQNQNREVFTQILQRITKEV